ncbi:alpha/beta fold hydrolase [Streptomyces minutiscleroticus]|uniref:alpha/beta fold hydrolase n=1 Tax=Streptomyces minutiscleroticus TaxID=68238 RepID=UPI0033231ECF
MLASDPEALRCGSEFYRALDSTIAQNEERKTWRLPLPVLAIGGEMSVGAAVSATMKLAAEDVQTVILPECGHYPAEEAPEQMLSVLSTFLAPCTEHSNA